MPDPMLRVISRLLDRQNQLEEKLRTIEQAQPGTASSALQQELVCENEIREALREVIDPEVGIDIVDLGLIKEIRVKGNSAGDRHGPHLQGLPPLRSPLRAGAAQGTRGLRYRAGDRERAGRTLELGPVRETAGKSPADLN